MQAYSPFDKRIEDLSPGDLDVLKNVNEGWYIEYKSEVVSARDLAKAVSAFANTYGGWLFLGVKERSKSNSAAGSFPGIPKEDMEGAIQRLRNSSTDLLNPTPYFKTKVLAGPCSGIGLGHDKAVFVVEVPESNTAPHIHKDGRIYRRVADGSEPKHETDRFILDQLWRRSDPIKKLTREWIEGDPKFTSEEEKTPYLRLLLCVDPWCQRDPWLDAPISEIRRIMSEDDIGIPSVPFDTVYTVSEGFIARQIKNNYANILGLTWHVKRNMSCEIIIPLPLYSAASPGLLREALDDYKQGNRYIKALKKHGLGHMGPKVVDLNFAAHVLIGVIAKYRRLLCLAGSTGEFYFKSRLLNAWRALPFVDIEAVVAEFEEYGVPTILPSTVSIPDGYDPDSFVHVKEHRIDSSEGKEQIISAVQAFHILVRIAIALGVPVEVKDEGPQGKRAVDYDEWIDAGRRAIDRQQSRNK